MAKPLWKRVLLKLSGEVLQGKGAAAGIDPEAVEAAARRIKQVTDMGIQVGLVIGAGNLFRGVPASQNSCISRPTADYMGMLATVMNALAMRDTLEAIGVPARVQTAISIEGVTDPFHQRKAVRHLEDGWVVIFGAGTGHPFFTTDTTAALRACEIGADAILKATKVDGVYSADPKKNPDALRYEKIAFTDALKNRLKVMDSTAFSLCMDNNIPIVVFDFFDPDVLIKTMHGDTGAATVVWNGETIVSRQPKA
jgi:uridylate kinase